MPASTTRLAPAGLAATLLPISKNVALALLAFRMLQQPIGVRAWGRRRRSARRT